MRNLLRGSRERITLLLFSTANSQCCSDIEAKQSKSLKNHRESDDKVISFKPDKQNIILMLGIQGSGKTTVTAKLARWLTRHGYRVGVIGADTWRPGALTQLKMNCSRINVDVYGEEQNKDAVAIVTDGLEYFRQQDIDIIVIDTAGRHKEETSLLAEMNSMYKVAKPDLYC